MDPLNSLRHLIRCHPIIDNHAHNLLSRSATTNYAKYPLEQIVSEAQGPALRNAPAALPLQRAAQQLAVLYDSPSADWEQVKAARDQWVQRDYEGLVRECLRDTHVLLLDDMLTDQDVEPYQWHDRFATAKTRRIVRIEAVAADTLAALSKSDDLKAQWQAFVKAFEQKISAAIADPAVVGFKSVICYRTGLNVQPTDDADATVRLLPSFARTIQQGSPFRVEDKPLNDWLVRCTLRLVQQARSADPKVPNKPLQLHTGLGDNDIDLVLANPAHLQAVIAQYPGADFVLLHSAYPYTREAGYLACCYPNVYLDLGEVFPMVSRDAQESIVRESMEIVPTTRLLWSTDGHFFPETFWLGNRQFREVLEKVLVDYVQQGDQTLAQAKQAAADILFHNSNRAYSLNEVPSSYEPSRTLPIQNALSPPAALDAFLHANPHVKYVWMQWLDYTNTVRLRIFPIKEFARIVRKQRRIGICLAVQWMLQDDLVAPQGSVTGQYYMEPDLTSLRPNAGLVDSKSASVQSYWKSEEGEPLEGCPRTTLQRVTTKLQNEFGIQPTCGFEIEVIFLKPVSNTKDGLTTTEFVPAVANHSWSQMTSDTRKMVPLLEEIAETLASIGIDLQQFHAESAPGQFEFILPPAAPVAAVDMLLTARQVVTAVAEQHGLRATLHPRPLAHAAGSAAHAHVSIDPPTKEDAFLAGVLEHFRSLVAFTLSQDTSYGRVQSGLWAGSEWVTWGSQNRETPIRKISPGHWEIKSLDGLANMYFAMAAFLAAGYLGVKGGKTLTAKDCLYDAATLSDAARKDLGITTRLPGNITEALSELESNKPLQEVIGPAVVENYLIVKRLETKRLGAMEEGARRKWLLERY